MMSNILRIGDYDPIFRVERLILRGKDVDVTAAPRENIDTCMENPSHLWVSLHQVSRVFDAWSHHHVDELMSPPH